jgi:hypothetical protein
MEVKLASGMALINQSARADKKGDSLRYLALARGSQTHAGFFSGMIDDLVLA